MVLICLDSFAQCFSVPKNLSSRLGPDFLLYLLEVLSILPNSLGVSSTFFLVPLLKRPFLFHSFAVKNMVRFFFLLVIALILDLPL